MRHTGLDVVAEAVVEHAVDQRGEPRHAGAVGGKGAGAGGAAGDILGAVAHQAYRGGNRGINLNGAGKSDIVGLGRRTLCRHHPRAIGEQIEPLGGKSTGQLLGKFIELGLARGQGGIDQSDRSTDRTAGERLGDIIAVELDGGAGNREFAPRHWYRRRISRRPGSISIARRRHADFVDRRYSRPSPDWSQSVY